MNVISGYPRIIFMGTPEFAVESLDALVQAGRNIVAVVTAPDKPSGRGMKMNASAVKKYALEKKLQLLQPEKLRDPAFISALRELKADLQVVVAFRMLPESVWSMPPMGTINVHASLLPKYRGAAPVNWAVINGEKETGVTTFKLVHEIDKGNILLQRKVKIDKDETAGELHDKLKIAGAELLVETIDGMLDGTVSEQQQESLIEDAHLIESTHAPKIFSETCRIDWTKTASEINNLIRGLSPFPGAFTELNGKLLKIYKADKITTEQLTEPGKIETDGKTFLRFSCRDGHISVKDMQLEGKKRMGVEEFLRGFRP